MLHPSVHTMTPPQEALLLEALAAGSEAAFTALYDHYQPRLLHYLMPIARQASYAQEAVQEVLFKVWTRRETLVGIASFEQYLMRMAKNQLLNILRKELHEQKYRDHLPVPSPSGADGEDVLTYQAYHQAATKAIRELPEKQQRVFLLRHQEDRTIADIAAIMGISEEAVYKNLSRAALTVKQYIRDNSDWFGLLLVLLAQGKNN